jgi:adenine-specific DNA-methyltransferase
MSDKLDMHSPNLVDINLEIIAKYFPNCLTETSNGKAVDFDLLKQELNNEIVEGTKERYRLEWPGKKEAIVTANLPTTKTLRPVRKDSENFDTTENLYIEGDNLEVLKLLQESYLGKIKMIYIDPPYNTGKDFVYKDNFTQDTDEFKEDSGFVDELNNRLVVNPETSGRYHSDWLTMMYPRLKLSRNLLTDDGVILINMDENEIINLTKLLEEVFGFDNDLGTIIWDKRNPKGDSKGIAYQHEYIVVFAKNKEVFLKDNELLRPKKNAQAIVNKAKALFSKLKNDSELDLINKEFVNWINSQNDFSGGEKAYKKIDINGRVYRGVSMAWPNKKIAPDDYFIPLIHPKTGKPCPIPERGWRNPSSTMKSLLENDLILFGEDETKQPERKYYLDENMSENLPSLLYYGGSDTDMLNKMKIPFDTPKVVNVCVEHILAFTKSDDIILDFFSGSATTAHAILQINADNLSNRKFIQVQLPETTDENSEAYKEGYKNICEIGKERIRRSAKKIKEETNAEIDYGFRVYRLDESNMQDVYYKPQDFNQGQLDVFADNVKPGRTADDLLAQVMLDWGLPLSLKIEQLEIDKKQVFKVAQNSLLACFDSDIDEAFAKEVAKHKPLRIVFKDSSFKDDTAKENVKQLLKQLSPETEMKVL